MRAVIVAFLASIVAFSASAETMRSKQGNDSARLYDTPCVNLAVLAHITPKYHAEMRKADAIVGSKPYEACWIVDGERAHLMYEDGDQGMILRRTSSLTACRGWR